MHFRVIKGRVNSGDSEQEGLNRRSMSMTIRLLFRIESTEVTLMSAPMSLLGP